MSSSIDERKSTCAELGEAVGKANIGKLVTHHELQIMHYYADIRDQVNFSFYTAIAFAAIGLVILIVTFGFVLAGKSEVSTVGTVGGVALQFIAGTVFLLHARTAKQFGTFYILLERTCRYMFAYVIAKETKGSQDDLLGDLVCIMATAPMMNVSEITIDTSEPGSDKKRTARLVPA